MYLVIGYTGPDQNHKRKLKKKINPEPAPDILSQPLRYPQL
jgi:hypothetical protein